MKNYNPILSTLTVPENKGFRNILLRALRGLVLLVIHIITPIRSLNLLFSSYSVFYFLISGRRGLDLAGLPVKQHSLNLQNARDLESPMMRKPFSPISSTDSSKSNVTNILDDLNKKHNGMLQKTLTSNSTPFSTPSKMISMAEVENRTPQAMAIPVPSTPSMVSIPMQMAITPASMQMAITPAPMQMAIIPAPSAAKSVDEEIEYSFEERRAGFVLPRSHLVNLMQV